MITPPWKASGAPSNSTSSIAETLSATARHALKSSITLNAFTTASAPIARSATFPQLTSNSKTTNQMTRFHYPFFQRKRGEKKEEYIRFLWDAFKSNCEKEKYQFAFLAYHMLTMSFVYFNIWQIRQAREEDFKKGSTALQKEAR